MKALNFVITFVATAFLYSSCEDVGSEAGVGPGSSGAYHYTSYDTNRVAVVRGWLTITYQDSSHITGEWRLYKIGDPQGIGPQSGSGKLVGSFYEGKLVIELNPQFRDSNLQLVGDLQQGIYRGEWIWISFIGITGKGTFEAIKS
jgi:hypothetical protein